MIGSINLLLKPLASAVRLSFGTSDLGMNGPGAAMILSFRNER
jgi:hypothetical protein